jgi:hypothetical protein
MQRFISIILIVAFLGSTTEFHELFKIPHLVYHFFEHLGENPDVSLAGFLHQHYSHNHDNHKDEHHDKGCLPFQGEHNCNVQTIHFYAQAKINLSLIPSVGDVRKPFPDSEFTLLEFLSNIWQPPKV